MEPPIDNYATCNECEGRGWVRVDEDDFVGSECPKCRGEGWVTWSVNKQPDYPEPRDPPGWEGGFAENH